MPPNPLTRAALLGAATGGRMFTGLAAVALTARPQAPTGLLGRIGTAAAVGAMVSQRCPDAPVSNASLDREPLRTRVLVATAVGASVAGSWVGSRWRSCAGPRLGALRSAGIEDLAVIAVAAGAVRRN
jgi:hypothetical protein